MSKIQKNIIEVFDAVGAKDISSHMEGDRLVLNLHLDDKTSEEIAEAVDRICKVLDKASKELGGSGVKVDSVNFIGESK